MCVEIGRAVGTCEDLGVRKSTFSRWLGEHLAECLAASAGRHITCPAHPTQTHWLSSYDSLLGQTAPSSESILPSKCLQVGKYFIKYVILPTLSFRKLDIYWQDVFHKVGHTGIKYLQVNLYLTYLIPNR